MDGRKYPEPNEPVYEGAGEDAVTVGHVGHVFGKEGRGWDVQLVDDKGVETDGHLVILAQPVRNKEKRVIGYRAITKAYADTLDEAELAD